MLTVDDHNLLVAFGRRSLSFFARTHASDAFNGASSIPVGPWEKGLGRQLAAVGTRRDETKRDSLDLDMFINRWSA